MKNQSTKWYNNPVCIKLGCAAVGTLGTIAIGLIKLNYYQKKLDMGRRSREAERKKIREEEQNEEARKRAEKVAEEQAVALRQQHELQEEESRSAQFEPLSEKLSKFINPIHALVGKLFGEGEIGVLFGPKGVGKSSLVYQLVESISNGTKCGLFDRDYSDDPTPQKVFVYDLEQHDNQLQKRLAGFKDNHNVFVLTDRTFPSVESWLLHVRSIANEIVGAKAVVVLDNITKLGGWSSANSIISLFAGMEEIQHEATMRNSVISFLIVGHSNKAASDTNPISDANLIGSSTMTDFASCIVAIGNTGKADHKYLKVLHNRNYEEPENVMVVKRVADLGLPIHFEFVCEKSERDVLPDKKTGEPSLPMDEVEVYESILYMQAHNYTNVQMANELGCSEGTIRNRKKEMKERGIC